jgi:hypothetical protein
LLAVLFREKECIMLKAIKVNRDGSVVISTRGFRRILDEKGNVLIELVAADNAKRCVEVYDSCFKNGESRARVVTYKQAAALDAAAGKPASRVPRRRDTKPKKRRTARVA